MGWFKSGVNKYYMNTEKRKQEGLDESRADIWTLTAICGERKKMGYMSNIILGLAETQSLSLGYQASIGNNIRDKVVKLGYTVRKGPKIALV